MSSPTPASYNSGRDVFAAPSNRLADPRARLLDGPRWDAMRADVLASLSLTEDAEEHLARLVRGLDAAWRQMADRLEEAGADAKVEIVVPEGGGRARLSVDKLGAVGEPESLTWLKATTEAMLPRIDLPDLLFEVHSWTGFLDAFGHVSERRTRMEGLLISLVALLVAESCDKRIGKRFQPSHLSYSLPVLSVPHPLGRDSGVFGPFWECEGVGLIPARIRTAFVGTKRRFLYRL